MLKKRSVINKHLCAPGCGTVLQTQGTDLQRKALRGFGQVGGTNQQVLFTCRISEIPVCSGESLGSQSGREGVLGVTRLLRFRCLTTSSLKIPYAVASVVPSYRGTPLTGLPSPVSGILLVNLSSCT